MITPLKCSCSDNYPHELHTELEKRRAGKRHSEGRSDLAAELALYQALCIPRLIQPMNMCASLSCSLSAW